MEFLNNHHDDNQDDLWSLINGQRQNEDVTRFESIKAENLEKEINSSSRNIDFESAVENKYSEQTEKKNAPKDEREPTLSEIMDKIDDLIEFGAADDSSDSDGASIDGENEEEDDSYKFSKNNNEYSYKIKPASKKPSGDFEKNDMYMAWEGQEDTPLATTASSGLGGDLVKLFSLVLKYYHGIVLVALIAVVTKVCAQNL